MNHSDQRHLLAAQGWLELGDWKSANEELDEIAAEHLGHPDVLAIRWLVYAKAGQWMKAVGIARALTKLAPDDHNSFVNLAYALHELKRTKEAWEILLPVAEQFPKVWTIRYNLACYAAQLGDLTGARGWLALAFKLGNAKEIKLMALDDPDLVPLWIEEE